MSAPVHPAARDETVIPLVEEVLRIDKREVETGRVRIHVRNEAHDVIINEALVRGDVDIERVRIDRRVDSVPNVRNDGATIIVPIVEEVLVVEKRLMLREEVHIRRRDYVEQHEETISLIRQHADVERADIKRSETGAAPIPPPSKEV